MVKLSVLISHIFFMEDSTQIVTWRLQYSQLCNLGISKLYSYLFFFAKMWPNYCFMVYVVNLSIIFFEYIYIYTKTSPSFEKKNKNVDTQNREQTESWCYCNSRACPQRGIINSKLYIKFIFVLWMGFQSRSIPRIDLLWNSWKVNYISNSSLCYVMVSINVLVH